MTTDFGVPPTSRVRDDFLPRPVNGVRCNLLSALLALLTGLALTFVLYRQQRVRLAEEQHIALQHLADESYVAVGTRLRSAEYLVRSVQTLFQSSDEVSPGEFEHLYNNLRPREQFPSLLALVYSQREVRADGTHFINTLVAPLDGNQLLPARDVRDQPANFVALLASLASDTSAMSAPFRLMQLADDSRNADGIVLRLPVYTAGAPPRSVEERRVRVRGSIAASFRVGDLISRALSKKALDALDISVSDVTEARPVPLFDSRAGTIAAPNDYFERRLNFGGRIWKVSMAAIEPPLPWLAWDLPVLPFGALISTLVALLLWSLLRTRRRALELGNRMSRRYRESEARFRALNELLPALVLLADVDDGHISYANQAARHRFGGQIGTHTLFELFEDELLGRRLQRADVGDCSGAEATLRSGSGTHFWASVSIAQVHLDGRNQVVMVASDITEQRALTDLLSYQASHDTLTDLYNRREFERQMVHALADVAAGAPHRALLYMDLDQFKLINDTSGHLAGDQLLAQLASVMRNKLSADDVLARLGGDEFGVLLVHIPGQAAADAVAERLRAAIDGYVFVWEQQSYMISASIGGVMIDPGQGTLDAVLAQADTACYMAKELGRNRVYFFSEQDDATARRHSEMEWANRLRWAIEQGRLLLAYQEVWPLAPQPGEGPLVELLLRFRDESGRLVLPGAFLPAAERYGLMPAIDRWVVKNALANFDHLHPAGSALQLAAINLSGASMDDPALVEQIIEWMARYHVEPSRVCFEITETVAVRQLSQAAHFMARLRAIGCKIALDDFGAGMSSFGYLKNLPVDVIKIDGSFIRDMLTDPLSRAIVRAVTDIGHQLGLKVVAEWVTDEEIMRTLVALGVDHAQGFSLHIPELAPFNLVAVDAGAATTSLLSDG